MNSLQRAITWLFNLTGAGRLLLANYLLQKKFLRKVGWNKSVLRKKPLDKSGTELPWFTYSFIAFLKEKIRPDMRIFEYGSGNSTLWFSNKGCSVLSVEHHKGWYDSMYEKIAANGKVEYLWRELDSKAYAMEILNHANAFDVIILDGRDRVDCCLNSLGALKENGVIIWDNSDRAEYEKGYQFLKDNGFKRLDFHGLGPINSGMWCTSVFYRTSNCLEI